MNDQSTSNSITKVLIVDDSASDRAIFRRFLEKHSDDKFIFAEAETISEGVEKLAQFKPECLLLDYDLPDGKGLELIERIVAERGKNVLPIVMLSGSSSIEIAVNAIKSGASDFLVKNNAMPADLVVAVKNALEKTRLVKEKEAADEKTRFSEERYRRLFDNTPLPAFIIDRESLQILAVNNFAINHFGYLREGFLNLKLTDLKAESKDCEEVNSIVNNTLENDSRVLSGLYRKKDGSRFETEINWHDISFQGHQARFVIIQDITERKEAERKLLDSEEMNRTALESSTDCVKLLDADGKLIYMNYNGMCLMEIDEFTKVQHCEWHKLWTEENQETVRQSVETAQRGEIGRFEGFCPTAKGTPKWWDVIVSPVRNAEGKIVRILSVSRDVTDRVLLQQEREKLLYSEKEARRVAEAANRSKDEFLAMVSHELRSPMNAMSGWAKMLEQGLLDPEKQSKAIQIINRNIGLQNALIEDLLDVSRIVSGKISLDLEEIDYLEVVKEILDTHRLNIESKGIKLIKEFPEESFTAKGDPYRLQQIIGNLLTNAAKFTPKGGEIVVSLKRNENQAIIFIKDSGIGIHNELLPYVFDRFRQADGSSKRKFGGLGLGLTIVKSLTEMHNGKVSVHSEGENKGTTFTLELPLVETQISSATNQINEKVIVASGDGKLLGGLKIATVDDQVDSLELLKFVLEDSGAEVFTFYSAREILNQIEQINPDVLITDVTMPEIDGFELIKLLRQTPVYQNKSFPIIALTGYGGTEKTDEIISAGFQTVISKPFDIDTIATIIYKVIRGN